MFYTSASGIPRPRHAILSVHFWHEADVSKRSERSRSDRDLHNAGNRVEIVRIAEVSV
jgi:hypothetical protein